MELSVIILSAATIVSPLNGEIMGFIKLLLTIIVLAYILRIKASPKKKIKEET